MALSLISTNEAPYVTQPIGGGFDDATDLVAQTYSTPGIGHIVQDDVASTIRKNTGAGGETQNPAYVAQPIAIQDIRGVEKAQNGKGWNDDGTAYTVDTHATQGVAHPIAIQGTLIGRGENSGPQGAGADTSGAMYTLTKTDVHAVAQPIAFAQNQLGEVRTGEVLNTLNTNSNASGRNTPMVAQPIGFNTRQDPDAWQGRTGPVDTHYGTQGVAQPVAFQVGPQSGEFTDVAPTLDCRAKNGPIQNQLGAGVMQPVAPALTASNDPSRSPQSSEVTQQVGAVYQAAMQVRRLTPTECERLQGFPDGHTNIPWRGKPNAPDGPRYKALGNSMAVPCMAWIGNRINQHDVLH